MAIRRIFVCKKPGFDTAARKLAGDLNAQLGTEIPADGLRIWLRYDVDGMEDDDFETAVGTIFSEPPVDDVWREEMPEVPSAQVLAVEYLPGQFDQRADSAAQCVQLLTKKERPLIRCATVYTIVTDPKNIPAVTRYLVNPVEARLASLEKPESLAVDAGVAAMPSTISGFRDFSDKRIARYVAENGLAMSADDLIVVRDYFKKEGRDPYELEIKVIDTYWSDHCRHTTYLTQLDEIDIRPTDNPYIAEAAELYASIFSELYKGRPEKYTCLMDIATIVPKYLKKHGLLKNLDESEEINACSIKVTANVDGKPEDWLVMFKNETHNHPTEIEPFGGAATCLGGAIRDPLSGRSYVYQAMRVTGAADPRTPLSKTLKGKLPQRVLSKTAAAGFSSYGNQIGLATGIVKELYHPDYVAKRLETGFVVGAVRADAVVRARPQAGDVVLLIGGETGRDGCGGATGSSKAHSKTSVETCGAEVQKGNPPTERKLQRLFRNPAFTRLVKRCNDFGAGGVCVAIGELADGLEIRLDKVPKKYEGLTATELAISESQERMAVVVARADLERVRELAHAENLEATYVADVTDSGRMKMEYLHREVCNLSRKALLDTNGAKAHAKAVIRDKAVKTVLTPPAYVRPQLKKGAYADAIKAVLSDLNETSQQGLGEMFDSTIGASTVLMPYGGKTRLVPSSAMAAKLPLEAGDTTTATVAGFGCDPALMKESPFMGAVYSIVDSVTKVVLAGAPIDTVYLTLQEYFLRLGTDPDRWGIPVSAMYGALYAQLKLGIAAIGGKDSMSGTFEKIDVPPTLISFALGIADANKVVTNVLAPCAQELYIIRIPRDKKWGMPDFDYYKKVMQTVSAEIDKGNISYAAAVGSAGAVGAVVKSALADPLIGVRFAAKDPSAIEELFAARYGDVVIATRNKSAFVIADVKLELLAVTSADGKIVLGKSTLSNADAAAAFVGGLDSVYPRTSATPDGAVETLATRVRKAAPYGGKSVATPRVLIPVFPGTNCEYDTARRFRAAGANVDVFVLRNLDPQSVEESAAELVKRIGKAQIIAFAGGFSGGDEPDGSGKLIATTFRSPAVAEAIEKFLRTRDGLMLGICNGFQALVKLGLLPYGAIAPLTADSPTLTYNNISRHVSTVVQTRVASTMSPWLAGCKTGQVYNVAVSHGEGKFVCSEADYKKMRAAGQIFSQYCDEAGQATLVSPFNPNGSCYAIEGITSPDGRILGKMGHIERIGSNVMKNIDGPTDMKIFESGVRYFG